MPKIANLPPAGRASDIVQFSAILCIQWEFSRNFFQKMTWRWKRCKKEVAKNTRRVEILLSRKKKKKQQKNPSKRWCYTRCFGSSWDGCRPVYTVLMYNLTHFCQKPSSRRKLYYNTDRTRRGNKLIYSYASSFEEAGKVIWRFMFRRCNFTRTIQLNSLNKFDFLCILSWD